MEYMLLKDGTVKVFEEIDAWVDVMTALERYKGVAYYWQTSLRGWRKIDPSSIKSDSLDITIDDLPDVIKLAHMLE